MTKKDGFGWLDLAMDGRYHEMWTEKPLGELTWQVVLGNLPAKLLTEARMPSGAAVVTGILRSVGSIASWRTTRAMQIASPTRLFVNAGVSPNRHLVGKESKQCCEPHGRSILESCDVCSIRSKPKLQQSGHRNCIVSLVDSERDCANLGQVVSFLHFLQQKEYLLTDNYMKQFLISMNGQVAAGSC